MKKQTFSTELNYLDTLSLKYFLKIQDIEYYASEVSDDLVHISIRCTKRQAELINNFIDTL
mgnify:CR=1 FL=1